MARGFAAVKEAANRIDSSSKDTSDWGPSVLFLKLPKDGDSAVVRFLEQGDDVYSYWYHDFSSIDKRNGWKTKVYCLDQEDEGVPCPGCENELPRKFQGLINLIWRDAPKYERDENNRFARDDNGNIIQKGTEDQVAVWRAGIKVFTSLGKKDVASKGLTSREFVIERSGEDLQNTTYSVEPEDYDAGASKLSAADKKLEKEKYDLEKIARADITYDQAEEFIQNKLDDSDSSDDDTDIDKFLPDRPFERKDED